MRVCQSPPSSCPYAGNSCLGDVCPTSPAGLLLSYSSELIVIPVPVRLVRVPVLRLRAVPWGLPRLRLLPAALLPSWVHAVPCAPVRPSCQKKCALLVCGTSDENGAR